MKRLLLLILAAPLAVSSFARLSVNEKIHRAADADDDAETCRILSTISDADLVGLPDSTLCQYHYLLGLYTENSADAIPHLLEAKRILESSLGIRMIEYLQVMYALAYAYDAVGDLDKALAVYQEGIVKTVYIREWPEAKEHFANLNNGLARLYEKKGWYSEVPQMWVNAWVYSPKDHTPFGIVNVYPLYMLASFFMDRERYTDALSVNRQMSEYVAGQVPADDPVWTYVHSQKGRILKHQEEYVAAAAAYRAAIDVSLKNNIAGKELELYYFHMIDCFAQYASLTVVDGALSEMAKVGSSLYPTALLSVSVAMESQRRYQEALVYIRRVLPLVSVDEQADYRAVENRYLQRVDNQRYLAELSSSAVPGAGTAEWFVYQENLANAYYADQQEDKCLEILINMVEEAARVRYSESEQARLVDLVVGCALSVGDYSSVVRYSDRWIASAERIYGNQSYEYLNSLNTTAVACIKTEDPSRAQELLDGSAPLLQSLFGKESAEYAIYLHNQGRVFQLTGRLSEAKAFYTESLAIHSRLNTPELDTARTRECLNEVEQLLRKQI